MATGAGRQQKAGRGAGSVAFSTFPGAVSGHGVLNSGSEWLSDPGQALSNLGESLSSFARWRSRVVDEQREFCKAMVTE